MSVASGSSVNEIRTMHIPHTVSCESSCGYYTQLIDLKARVLRLEEFVKSLSANGDGSTALQQWTPRQPPPPPAAEPSAAPAAYTDPQATTGRPDPANVTCPHCSRSLLLPSSQAWCPATAQHSTTRGPTLGDPPTATAAPDHAAAPPPAPPTSTPSAAIALPSDPSPSTAPTSAPTPVPTAPSLPPPPSPSPSPNPNAVSVSILAPALPASAPSPITPPSGPGPSCVPRGAAPAVRAPSPVSAAASSAPTALPPPGPLPSPSSTPPSAPMAATRVVMHQLVLPADVNGLGICTGGQVLSWIDVCAGLSAKTLAQGPCVTASVDAVHFLRPCRLGCVVVIAAQVARTFRTSMEVAVVVESEDMRTGVRHHCCSAHLTFVVRPSTTATAAATAGSRELSVGGLPRVYPTTPEHRAVWEGAEVRRQLRLERRTRVRRNPALQEAERICRLKPITHREGGPTLPPPVTPTNPQRKPPAASSGSPPVSQSPSFPDHAPVVLLSRQPLAPEPASVPSLTPPELQSTPPAAAAAAVVSCGSCTALPAGGGGGGDVLYGTAFGPAADAVTATVAAPPEPEDVAAPPEPPPARQLVPPGCTTAYMTQLILPQHANTLNITFGGQVMVWMEQCAYISASRLRAPALLTAAMDSVSFVQPTRVGDILYATAQVTAIFGSSLEVMVSVFGESPYAGAGSSGAAAGGGGGGGGAAAGGEGQRADGSSGGSGGSGSGGDSAGAAGGIFHCADAYVTVVAVEDTHASPVPVPFELDPKEPADVLRYQGAIARRAERLALRGQFAASEAGRVSLDGAGRYSPPPEADEVGSVLEAMPPL